MIHDGRDELKNGFHLERMLLAKPFKTRLSNPEWTGHTLETGVSSSQRITLSASNQTTSQALREISEPQTTCKKQTYSRNIFPIDSPEIPYRFPLIQFQARLPGVWAAQTPEEGSALGFGPHLPGGVWCFWPGIQSLCRIKNGPNIAKTYGSF